MTKYDVVSAHHLEVLIEEVNVRIHTGWKLQGGICINDRTLGAFYYQAMIYEDSKVEKHD